MKGKRSLGQNFLTSPRTAESIVRAANIESVPTVLEVGPGHGMLTRALLLAGKKVIAVEKDDALFAELTETFAKEIGKGKLLLIHADVLDVEKNTVFKKHVRGEYAVVANIPYNITGKLIPFFLHLKPQPKSVTLMVQYEVAKRICDTKTEGESILSLSVKIFAQPAFLKKISAGSFSPKPNVDSALLQLTPHAKSLLGKIKEEDFFDLVKKGFAHKRKVLKNNIGARDEELRVCTIAPNARAETLTSNDLLCLLSSNKK